MDIALVPYLWTLSTGGPRDTPEYRLSANHSPPCPRFIRGAPSPPDDQNQFLLPGWGPLSLPAGLLAQGAQSDQSAVTDGSLMGFSPCL